METKIYFLTDEELTAIEQDINSITDEQFINEAENKGNIYSLIGFQNAFNSGEISDQWFIKILPV